jgi:hypothetical protein
LLATQKFLEYLKILREQSKESWANGAFTAESESGTIQTNAREIGRVMLLEDLINMNYDEIMEGTVER